MVSAETPSKNSVRAPNLFMICVGDKSPGVIHSVLSRVYNGVGRVSNFTIPNEKMNEPVK